MDGASKKGDGKGTKSLRRREGEGGASEIN